MQDKKLISIIQEYILNKGTSHTLVYIDEMVRDIMHTHREYGRKQIKPFTKYVKEAYDHICRNRNVPCPSTDSKSPVTKAAEVKRKSLLEEAVPNSKRLRLQENQLTSIQNYKPFFQGVDLTNAMLVERYKMNSAAQSPLSNIDASCQATNDRSLYVIDRTGGTSGMLSSVPADGSVPDVPCTDAELPSDEQISSLRVENCSVITAKKSPSLNEIDQRADLVQEISSTEKDMANTSATHKKKKIRRTNEDDLDGILDRKAIFKVEESSIRFENYPGLANLLSVLNKRKIFLRKVPKGIILTGPRGCGKSTLAEALVGRLKLPFIRVEAEELSDSQNKNEEFLYDLVEKAVAISPCALIIENIRKKSSSESSRTDDLLRKKLMALFKEVNDNKKQIWIIATTSSITSVDEVLIGKKGFEVVVDIGLPKDDTKVEILNEMVKRCGVNRDPELNFQQFVKNTPAYAAGDLQDLVDNAVEHAMMRTYEEKRCVGKPLATEADGFSLFDFEIAGELDDAVLTLADFKLAIKDVIPAAKYSAFFTESPNVSWDEDIGGMEELREELHYNFVLPVTNPEKFEKLKLSCRPTGILLHGPPGCGKTLVAKAMATETCMNFMTINGPELLQMYVGESERMIRDVFEKARKAAPCIIYFDEIDSLCEKRDSTEGGTKVNVVNQILPILDGISNRGAVYVIGSTNRLDRVDPALLRPGRFDKHHYVGLPNAEQRYQILLAITKRGSEPVLASDVNLEELAKDPGCENFSGADLNYLICQAGADRVKQLEKEGTTGVDAIFKINLENALKLIKKERSQTRVIELKKVSSSRN